MQFEENKQLAPYTTLGVGGPARWFAVAAAEEEIVAGVRFARERRLPLFVLGGGSNLLISDRGFAGLVLHIALCGIAVRDEGPRRIYSVAAGEPWDPFVARAVSEDCAGIECLSGIPGTVGGTPVQNVGAYGQEVGNTILTVRVFDRESLSLRSLDRDECGFAYRRSIFNTGGGGNRYIVSEVQYSLEKQGRPAILYQDLQRYFGNHTPSLAEVRQAVLSIRAGKGMLIVPGDPDSQSAGSFFKNPIVSVEVFEELARRLHLPSESIPHYPNSTGKVKIPAAWLIERSGFSKGFVMGKAGISRRHTLALINRGGATAQDLIALSDRIRRTVSDRFGILLQPEPVWVEETQAGG